MLECIGLILMIWLCYKLVDHLLRIPTIGRYSERYVLVTGAGRGFGHEICVRLDRLGCHVFAAVRSEKSSEQLKATCSNRLVIVYMDVVDSNSIKKARHEIEAKLTENGKQLWAVINNAGISSICRPEWLTLQDYEDTLRVNSLGVVDVTLNFLPLIKRSRGRIINISSGAGRNCHWFFPHYNMSKYALEAFSDSLRRAVRAYGVKVLLIEPGLYKTDMADSAGLLTLIEGRWKDLPADLREEFGEDYLIKMKNATTKMSKGASDKVHEVIDAYEHAVIGRYPRARYVLGNATKYLWIPVQSLPEWLSDYIADRLVGPPTPRVLEKL